MNSNNKQTSRPKLTLNDADKLYLATATKSVDKLTFIYTLACLKENGKQWNIFPTTEISTFDNVKDADIYFKTVNQIMDYQQKSLGPQKIKEMLEKEIREFTEKTR